MKNNLSSIIIILLIILVGYLFILQQCSKDDNGQLISNVESLRDSITVITSNPIIINSDKQLLKYVKDDSIYKKRIEKLLASLKAENKEMRSLLMYNTNTVLKLADKDSNEIMYTSLNYYFTDTIFPTYRKYITNQFEDWIKGNITVGYDTFSLDLTVKNAYNITTGYKGFKEYVDIESLNPYTKTEDVRYYMRRASRLGIGLGFGLYYDPFRSRGGFAFNLGFIYKIK